MTVLSRDDISELMYTPVNGLKSSVDVKVGLAALSLLSALLELDSMSLDDVLSGA